MAYVVQISQSDLDELKVILMDRDGDAALSFLKEKVAKPIDRSLSKAMDVSKGHV